MSVYDWKFYGWFSPSLWAMLDEHGKPNWSPAGREMGSNWAKMSFFALYPTLRSKASSATSVYEWKIHLWLGLPL